MKPLPKQMDRLERWRLEITLPHIRGYLLDVDCGYNNLVHTYGHGVGVDAHRWDGIDAQIGSASILPFPENCFETVTVIAALNHIPDREAALREIWRVLRPDGKLLITMIGPLTGWLAHLVFKHDETVRGGIGTGELKGMTGQEVRNLLDRSGFALRAEQRFEFGLNTLFIAEKHGPVPGRNPPSGHWRKLSIVIPVYNEQSTIKEVIDRVLEVCLGSIEKEIIICDDGSTDGSIEVIERERSAHSEVIRVHVSAINLGKGAAIRFGFKYATGDIIIIQDADLELDPAEYADLIQPILDGRADVVYGSRFKDKNPRIHFKTRLANRFLTTLTNLLFGSRLTDMETAYKVFRADVIKNLRLRCVGFDIEPEITAQLLKAECSIHEVAVDYNPRTDQEGKKITWRDGIEAIYTLLKCRLL